MYGSDGIYDCANAGDMALTFDDGPFIYTSHILDLLDQYNASATFFITGNNNGKSHSTLSLQVKMLIGFRQRRN
jgi:peptidoglycan/xylan/chitin deacetylase (PgdA/CDA1 family)